ncbi:MAG: non-homologous end-joining DNA ligase [Verrucomicrobiota bacterium]|nr:non-homologous end-joining DNA ligase [Verrucomicrobiota bacterium]
MSLRKYATKRDFSRTREPKASQQSGRRDGRLFVIQKHDASRLHYDFRLELDGALKSWAVPKGMPFEKGDKRLAVQVEDHPVEYASFEGVIPKGQYGGGTVMVWDTGTYETPSENPRKELESGKLHVHLHGQKLEGEWYLVRLRDSEQNQWLLIKGGDSVKPISLRRDDESVLTGRTMRKIAADRDAQWHSNRETGSSTLSFIEPMKARLAEKPPSAGDWIYEIKFDGFRALALKDGKHVRLLSRNEKPLGDKFPEIVQALAGLGAEKAIIDGEIVALESDGRSSFQLLQAFELGEQRPPIFFYSFDLLHLNGKDFQKKPLGERKVELEQLLKDTSPVLRYSAAIVGDPDQLLAAVRERGLEGLIGKRTDSIYESGQRSGAWIKLKCLNEQGFVIGGYTAPSGTRKYFGALLVGYFKRDQFLYAGKVGTGFSERLLRSIHAKLQEKLQSTCPFVNLPEKRGGRWSPNLTAAEMRACRWLVPELVCQVKYAEWTRDGKLRQPVFVGLREDKVAGEVVREGS